MKMSKDFKVKTPAMNLISIAKEEEQEEKTIEPVPPRREYVGVRQHIPSKQRRILTEESKRSRRLALMIPPAMYDDLYALAFIRGVSINEMVNRLLHEHIEDNALSIERYKEFTKGGL